MEQKEIEFEGKTYIEIDRSTWIDGDGAYIEFKNQSTNRYFIEKQEDFPFEDKYARVNQSCVPDEIFIRATKSSDNRHGKIYMTKKLLLKVAKKIEDEDDE